MSFDSRYSQKMALKQEEIKVTMQLLLLRCPFKPYTAAETTVAETLMALLFIF